MSGRIVLQLKYGDGFISCTIPKEVPAVVRRAMLKKMPRVVPPPATLGEEVEMLVREYYAARGEEVPVAERVSAAEIDAAEAAARRAEEKALAAAGEAGPGEKPEFGTPAFWAWARKVRAAKNAERAAAGLPPLPTAAEKRAAKAKRAEAKAAKKASA